MPDLTPEIASLLVTITELESEDRLGIPVTHRYKLAIPASTNGLICDMLARAVAFTSDWTPGTVDIDWEVIEGPAGDEYQDAGDLTSADDLVDANANIVVLS